MVFPFESERVNVSFPSLNVQPLIFIFLSCFRLVHTLNGEICVCGHSVINYENEDKCRYFYSVWDLNEKMCIREIDVEESEADFYGEFGSCPIDMNASDDLRHTTQFL